MNDPKIDSKESLRIYGIFIAILAVFFMSAAGLARLSRSAWENGLRSSVKDVLDERFPGEWTVGRFLKISSPFATSAACYEIQNRGNGESCVAVIVRTATLYGPVPAVFISGGSGRVEFAGFSGVHGRVRRMLEDQKADIRINYWKRRVPAIIDAAGV